MPKLDNVTVQATCNGSGTLTAVVEHYRATETPKTGKAPRRLEQHPTVAPDDLNPVAKGWIESRAAEVIARYSADTVTAVDFFFDFALNHQIQGFRERVTLTHSGGEFDGQTTTESHSYDKAEMSAQARGPLTTIAASIKGRVEG